MLELSISQADSTEPIVVARLNARLQPMDRGEYFEDPLAAALEATGKATVTGGGTMLGDGGEVEYCDIELDVASPTEDVLALIAATLEDIGAPKGSKLVITNSSENSSTERTFGKTEGLAVYLNGVDLPDEVYQTSDFNFVCSEFTRLLGTEGRILSFWQGPTETALYLYGTSFAEMSRRLEGFLATYPLCQKCRIVQIA